MVRIMAGTLMDVYKNKIGPEDIAGIIDARDRTKAGMTAPPDGLYLYKVEY
jgi:tRNA pseudouridine38-40 synthase